MFTGIIRELGKVTEVKKGISSARIEIAASQTTPLLRAGDSVSVNGVCLTVTSIFGTRFVADIMPETLNKTNLGQLTEGSIVNIEPSMKVGDQIGGHFVSGHVDCTGKVIKIEPVENARLLEIEIPESVLKYLVPKCSVAVDGVSLTVVDVKRSSFTVSIIPHTLIQTVIGTYQVGSTPNIEADMLSKYVYNSVQQILGKLEAPSKRSSLITYEFLEQHGFL